MIQIDFDKLLYLRKQTMNNGKLIDQYLSLLDDYINKIKKLFDPEEKSKVTECINLSAKLLHLFDQDIGVISGTNYEDLSDKAENIIIRRRKSKRRKKLSSQERYKLFEILLINFKCKLAVLNNWKSSDDFDIIDSFKLGNVEKWDYKDKVKNLFKNFINEIKCFQVGNKIFLFNELNKLFYDLLEKLDDEILKKNIEYFLLWSLMNYNWVTGTNIILRRERYGFKSVGISIVYFFLWITSGFGEKPIRYFTSLISINVLFGLFYYVFKNAEIGNPPRPIDSYLDGFYFSIVTFTTLGYGDITPFGYTKIVAGLQAILGYIMLALLIHLIIKKLKI